jgi:phenylpyruvate tautomerase PptA (4-oxalocrotonate tautomerase family)
MPNIIVTLPSGSFPGETRAELVRRINEAAAQAEQIPANPRQRMLCWVSINESASGQLTCGGQDISAQMLPCMVMVYLPAGVLDAASRKQYVQLIQDAFAQTKPAEDKRMLMTSVVLHEVADGQWGANGNIWQLADFAKAAGFAHLQHLVKAS